MPFHFLAKMMKITGQNLYQNHNLKHSHVKYSSQKLGKYRFEITNSSLVLLCYTFMIPGFL